IRIEWLPESNQPYLSLKWQEPATKDEYNTFGFSSEAGQLGDYYFIYGKNIDEVISGYRQLTGKATIVPKWALGFWQSRERYKYEKGSFATISFNYIEKTKSLRIGERKGAFAGMRNKRTFRVRLISAQKPFGVDASNFDKEIIYDGNKLENKLGNE
ncbi:MAG: DUF5110 domain-containing protein, partial [Chitinophagaceae bacterium]